MSIKIDSENVAHGLLGLVIALVEIIRDALQTEAIKRMEEGSLSEEEMERLGQTFMDIHAVLDKIKEDQRLSESVKSVRESLDNAVHDLVTNLTRLDFVQELEESEAVHAK